MTLSRTTVGRWHLISGTASEVLTELNTAKIPPAAIVDIAADATSCIYMRGV